MKRIATKTRICLFPAACSLLFDPDVVREFVTRLTIRKTNGIIAV